MDRAAAAELLEDLVGRAVLPVLAVGDVEGVEVRELLARQLVLGRLVHRLGQYWLASQYSPGGAIDMLGSIGSTRMSPDPRIPPLPPEEWDGDLKRVLEAVPPGIERRLGDNNIFPTFARNPELFRVWLPLGRVPAGGGQALRQGP